MKKLLVVLLVLGLAAPAMAQNWNFYGSLRTHLGYYKADSDYSGGPAMDPSIAGGAGVAGAGSDEGTLLSLSGQSRFGARGVVSDQLYGLVEFGFQETNRAEGQIERPYLRLLFADYNFGAGKLRVGKAYTPGTFLGWSNMIGDIGDQGDANMLVAGLAYIGRQPQIALFFGGFELALIENHTAAGTLTGLTDKDFDFPRIEAAYTFRTPVFTLRPVVGFQTYDVESATASEDITSYMFGLGAQVTLGPAYIKATASFLQNPGNYGQSNLLAPALLSAALNATGGVEDAMLLQGTFVVGMRINPMIGVEAGFGYSKAERDNNVAFGGANAEQTGMLFCLQAPITLAKGVQLIPELGYLDRGDLEVGPTDIDQGRLTYFDINFRVDF
jgi:hypothetical protein